MKTKQVHIRSIKGGDTVMHNDKMMTVCNKDITRGFCGTCLFGDSYKTGMVPVILVTSIN